MLVQAVMPTGSERVHESEIPFWLAPWTFFVHAIVGTSIFSTIGAAAVLLNVAVIKMEAYQVEKAVHFDRVILWGLRIGEYALFIIDLVLFLVFLCRTAKRTWRQL